jgi:hypothetical protein
MFWKSTSHEVDLFELIERGDIKSFRKNINEKNIKILNKRLQSPLTFVLSIKKGSGVDKFIDILLNKNADVNSQDVFGNTALMYSIMNYPLLSRRLLTKPIIPNIQNREGMTALHISCTSVDRARHDVADVLLDLGASVHLQDNYGNTPLHYALKNVRESVVLKILSQKPDINLENNEGITPLDLAFDVSTVLEKTLLRIIELNPDWSHIKKIRNFNISVRIMIHIMQDKLPEHFMKTMKSFDITRSLLLRMGYKLNPTKPSKILEVIRSRKTPFKWQAICKEFGNNRLSALKNLAKLHGLSGYSQMNKRELCKQLALQLESMKNPKNCYNTRSLHGDLIKDIPPHLVYTFQEADRRYCVNILEMVDYIKQGNKTNPFTEKTVDVDAVFSRYNLLIQMLSEHSINKELM